MNSTKTKWTFVENNSKLITWRKNANFLGSNGCTRLHTHTFFVPRNDATHPHEHTPSSVIHYYQRAKFTAANTASSKIPCSILWLQYYRVFCSADTKAGLNSGRRLGIDVMVRHKGSTVNPAHPLPSTFCSRRNKSILSFPQSCLQCATSLPAGWSKSCRSAAADCTKQSKFRLITITEQKGDI